MSKFWEKKNIDFKFDESEKYYEIFFIIVLIVKTLKLMIEVLVL